MTLSMLCWVLIFLALGYFLVELLWPKAKDNHSTRWLRLAFSAGIGVGLLSFLMFFWLMFVGQWMPNFNFVLWPCLILWLMVFRRRRGAHPPQENSELASITRVYFLLALGLAVTVFVFYFLKNPHGNWDAWSHWNLRARFIYWGGAKWANFLHPDYWNPLNYPMMWPMAVSAGWGFVGAESHWVPGILSMVFAFSTILLLSGTVGFIRGKTQGFLAGILLAGTPYFLTHGVSQYSDIPVGFFFLATFAAAALYDADEDHSPRFLILAGVTAGFAAWTKNEGLLFIGCFFLARLFTRLFRLGFVQTLREFSFLLLGLMPVLSVDVYVKTQLYAPKTILETRGIPYNFGNFTDLARYKKIALAFGENLLQFGHWQVSLTLLLVLYLFWMGLKKNRGKLSSGGGTLLTLLLLACGYFAVYLSSPHNLKWHLNTSLDRLLLCMWPSFLFGYFLVIRTPEEVLGHAEHQEVEVSNRVCI